MTIHNRPVALILAVFGLALLGLLIAQNTLAIAGGERLSALLLGQTGDRAVSIEYWYAYMPRLAVALMAGAGLGIAGAVLQQVLQNPLASPATLGVTSGAQLALAVALLLAPDLHADHPFLIALAGSFLAWGLVSILVGRRMDDPVSLVLTGMVVSFTAGAITTCLFLLKNQYLTSLFLWGAGDLAQHDWQGARFLLPRLGLATVALLLLSRPLTLMGLGRESARSSGLATGLFSFLALGIAIFVASAVTATVGLIAFVGLASPHVASLLGMRRVVPRLLTAGAAGALLLGLVDQGIQFGLSGLASFLPAGALTGILGAPLLLYLLKRLPAAGVTSAGETLPVSAGLSRPAERRLLVVLAVLLSLIGFLAFYLPAISAEIAWAWRAPRVFAAILSGAALGLAGCLVQRLLSNPMASPEIIGISTGAVMGVIAVMLILPAATAAAQLAGALLGALAILVAILAYASRHDLDPRRLILAGIAITAFADGLILMFLATGDPRGSAVLAFMSGSTYRVAMEDLTLPATMAVAGTAATLATLRWLDILSLGGTASRSLGLPLGFSRLLIIVATALLTASACLFVGPISFVGLTAPHIARLSGLRRTAMQLPGAAMIGAILVVAADWLGRQIFRPYELPAGLTAILLGALVLATVLLRHGAGAGKQPASRAAA
ncbi:Fe(3+)-hydroxamate ABC transporter permease FhuB [uncultured Nitratireductor sp.]|uniref:Fe(3+)-hydroxamate ABC transporter permease FhuB n=1 Tax=uncultured Nitratireductor sp. TaxID=520953 RepID=UPI0025F5B325|nr:Fe(3+)-hydroxamate ABC transporter permease FhuB [uncultured Nitratireductor sp.]